MPSLLRLCTIASESFSIRFAIASLSPFSPWKGRGRSGEVVPEVGPPVLGAGFCLLLKASSAEELAQGLGEACVRVWNTKFWGCGVSRSIAVFSEPCEEKPAFGVATSAAVDISMSWYGGNSSTLNFSVSGSHICSYTLSTRKSCQGQCETYQRSKEAA